MNKWLIKMYLRDILIKFIWLLLIERIYWSIKWRRRLSKMIITKKKRRIFIEKLNVCIIWRKTSMDKRIQSNPKDAEAKSLFRLFTTDANARKEFSLKQYSKPFLFKLIQWTILHEIVCSNYFRGTTFLFNLSY
jgi:hypothetical protein